MKRRPRLLFITPTIPARTGSGLAMRAGLFVEALSRTHEVHLLFVAHVRGKWRSAIAGLAGDVARVVKVEPELMGDRLLDAIAQVRGLVSEPAVDDDPPLLAQFASEADVARAAAEFAGIRFDVVHVLRLHLAPFAAPYVEQGCRCVLDLDDDEVRTRRRLSELLDATGSRAAARFQAQDTERYRRFEREQLPRFDMVIVGSQLDREEVSRRLRLRRVEIVPNSVRIPSLAPTRRRDGTFVLLFLGSMGYLPNHDGALFLCREVLPHLRRAADREVRVNIVGGGARQAVKELASLPGVAVTGFVPDVAPCYAAADMAAIAIRAGGGTRTKALEAFAHRVPVVGTSIGVEGIDVTDRTHLLVADTAEAFAAGCLELMRDPGLADALAARAFDLVAARYSVPVVSDRIRAIYGDGA